MLDSYLRYRSYFCIKDYGSWTCYGNFLRAVELWITCSSTKGEKHAFLVISTALYNIDTIILKKHLLIYLTRSKVKVHEHTCTSTSISELIKHLSVRIKIKYIYIHASKCIITLQIILCNFDCRNNDKTENTYTNLLLLRHLCHGVNGRQRWLDIVICTCISNALYYSIRIALFSYLAHQLNMILDESSFNSMSNTMVSEHIDYPTCSYYMKNQHYNATYNAMLDNIALYIIHHYHPMLNCRPPQNDCFGSYLYSDFICFDR